MVDDVASWPKWWPGYRFTEIVSDVRQVKMKSDLSYTLDFNFTVLTRMTLHEQTETRWALINLTAKLGGRRLLEHNHKAAMRWGELGMRSALARGYVPPNLDATAVPDGIPDTE